MDGDKNINLLPDDLRGQEDKIKFSKNVNVPVNFHIPQKPQEPKIVPPPVPVPPPTSPVLKPIIKTEDNQPKKNLVEQPVQQKQVKIKKSKKGSRFFAKLFAKRKKKPDLPPGITEEISLGIDEQKNSLPPLPIATEPKEGNTSQALIPPNIITPLTTEMDVNLVPEGTYLLSNSKILKTFIVPIIISLILGVLLYAGLIGYQKYFEIQSEKLLIELEEGEANLIQYKVLEDETEELVDKIETARAIVDRHVYWTKVFTVLENLTIQDVYYDNIAANVSGIITLSAIANSYTSVARQYIVLQEATDLVKDVKITGADGELLDGKINFNILLLLQPDVFYSLDTNG